MFLLERRSRGEPSRNKAARDREYGMNPTQEDGHAAVAPDHITWTYCEPVSCRFSCGRPTCRRRIVHLTRMLILPARERLPERTIQGSAGRLAARLPRHLLGPSGMEGTLFAPSPARHPRPK